MDSTSYSNFLESNFAARKMKIMKKAISIKVYVKIIMPELDEKEYRSPPTV
jgi:hypothetical protein